MPGIKVDKGPVDIPGFPGETVTEGLDGLRARVKEYKELGAKFAKWRAVITIGDGIPTYTCLEANAHALARYAALCQEGGIVPIVEPEVLLDGNHTHRALRGSDRTRRLQDHVLRAARTARPSRRHDSQTEHGGFRQRQPAPSRRRRSRRAHDSLLEAHRSGRGSGHRVSVRRTKRRQRHRTFERNESSWGRIPGK